MTTRTTSPLIGRTGRYLIGSASYPVTIIDARELFGRVDVCITPINGEGEQWVTRSAVRITEEKEKSNE